RALAVAGDRRAKALPDVPTVAESGFPGYEANTWNGMLAPAGTPRETVDKLNRAFTAALAAPETKARFANLMAEPVPSSPEAFGNFMRSELAKYEPLVKASGARVD
ncbi:MAG: tripartite tricarboxylate transporter substrate binding protein, partial [Flavobacteriaceae bacterium]|nr:tripartite tricarboxylate transporter substrate binding protein [Flavobacteriaceae bacterium]